LVLVSSAIELLFEVLALGLELGELLRLRLERDDVGLQLGLLGLERSEGHAAPDLDRAEHRGDQDDDEIDEPRLLTPPRLGLDLPNRQ
jgi:hypothetical protein